MTQRIVIIYLLSEFLSRFWEMFYVFLPLVLSQCWAQCDDALFLDEWLNKWMIDSIVGGTGAMASPSTARLNELRVWLTELAVIFLRCRNPIYLVIWIFFLKCGLMYNYFVKFIKMLVLVSWTCIACDILYLMFTVCYWCLFLLFYESIALIKC